MKIPLFVVILVIAAAAATAPGQADPRWSVENEALAGYFAAETERLESACLAGIKTAEDWKENVDEYRRQLQEMLGLDPWPDKTPLETTVTGTLDHPEFTVENLHYQSRPGLYVTANLYVPKHLNGEKAPAILYVCGHGKVKIDGVSYGNKVNYQHHAAWFARQGYVCLIIDTLQLGEIEGIHHGTHREGRWWWLSRGYTPAGVEAWNGIRGIDLLVARPEVDPARIGVTGRSGGGAYSWWVAALDERVKAAVPVAGVASMRNHVVDGCIEGHCDCMFMVNRFRWDFPQLCALVAPRALLITNTDKDRIFPLDGVVDVYTKTRRIYDLLGAGHKIGLTIIEGPHKDTQPIRVPAFHWFERHLKGKETTDTFEIAAVKFFEPEQLKVFDELPEDEKNTTIDETFVPAADGKSEPGLDELRDLIAMSWPELDEPALLELGPFEERETGRAFRMIKCTTQPGVTIDLIQVADESSDASEETESPAIFTRWASSGDPAPELPGIYLFPRSLGPVNAKDPERKRNHLLRRFALLGQTFEGMQAFDIYRAIEALRHGGVIKPGVPITLSTDGRGLLASLFLSPPPARVDLGGIDLDGSEDFPTPVLGLSQRVSPQQILAAARKRGKVTLRPGGAK